MTASGGTATNPLLQILTEAAAGRFPPADSGVEVIGRPRGKADAVVAFTAHHVIATGVAEETVRAHLPSDPLTGPMTAAFLSWLGSMAGAAPGMVDLVLAAPGTGEGVDGDLFLEPGPVTIDHPRVVRAASHRAGVRVLADAHGRGLLAVGFGLAGRREVSVEVDPGHRGRGVGRSLALAALGLAPAGEFLFAQVSPGNAASVRAFLAAGFVPIGGEVLFLRPARRPEPTGDQSSKGD